jgi:type II secretory pathway pseudopilin PulG
MCPPFDPTANAQNDRQAAEGALPARNLGVRRRRGFSLVEALVALSITALAGSVLLLSVDSSLATTMEALQRTIADGLAQQVMDEMLTKQYMEDGGDPLGGLLDATAWELLGLGTERFNDVDDYAGYLRHPTEGIWGEAPGTGDDQGNLRLDNFRLRADYFQNWQQRVLVYFVNPNDHTVQSGSPTAYRALEVHIELVGANGAVRPLASRKRVIAYVPPSS